MALIWFRLHDLSRNLRLINAALKAIDLVKLAQPMRNPNPGLFGGIPGSDPVHGPYIQGALPTGQRNFLSMHCSTSTCIGEAGDRYDRHSRRCRHWRSPIVLSSSSAAARRLNTVMLTTAHSQKVPQMLTAWRERDIGNLIVVV
jgi:hypothetical protein